MPISDTATNATQSNPFAALAASQTNPSMNAPGLSFQSINTNPMNVSASQANPQGVLDVLSQHGPQSLTSTLMPLYQQLFGAQSGALSQNRDMQAQTGRANAQSDAMRRGLTGSSIESAGMQGAQQSADMGYNQAYSQLLSNIVGQYTGAAQTDIGSQQSYYQNIAQALGQTYASNVQQEQFNRQLQAGIDVASRNSKSALWAAGIGAGGNILGALLGSRPSSGGSGGSSGG